MNSTPTFFVNGKRLSGAQSLEGVQGADRSGAREGRQDDGFRIRSTHDGRGRADFTAAVRVFACGAVTTPGGALQLPVQPEQLRTRAITFGLPPDALPFSRGRCRTGTSTMRAPRVLRRASSSS